MTPTPVVVAPGSVAARRLLHRVLGLVDRRNWPLTLAFALLLLALVLPPMKTSRPAYRVFVVFDITQSMDVEDVALGKAIAAGSRMEAARVAARELLRSLPCGSEVGWGVFADSRVMPLLLPVETCEHYQDLLGSLDAVGGAMRWANASNVSKGAIWSLRVARQLDKPTQIAFLTDGQEAPPLRTPGMPPLIDVAPGDVQGVLVGVGGELAVPIPKTSPDGRRTGYWQAADVVQPDGAGPAIEHLSKREDGYLRPLADWLGLRYAVLTDEQALARAVRAGEPVAQVPVDDDLRWLPASVALLLLLWRFRPEPARPRAHASRLRRTAAIKQRV
jgi:mxaL protein